MIENICLKEKFSLIQAPWIPKIIGELNGQYVKIVKFLGAYDWHFHKNEDEMFLVTEGSFTLELRDSSIHVSEGEFVIVPKGVEHRPVAYEEAHVVLFEPETTLNTGNVITEKTLPKLESI